MTVAQHQTIPSLMQQRGRLRVAHVVLQLETGGMEKLLVEFARHADRDRFDLRFLCLAGQGRLVPDIEAQGWPVTCLNEPPGRRPGLILRLASLFREWRLDIVHTHNTKPLLYAGPAARLAGVPCVLQTRHGQPYRSSRRRKIAFRLASFTANRVVCVSEDSRQMTERNGVRAKRLMTLWNGIDLSRFHLTGPAQNGPAVLVARLSPEKDVATLIRAVALLAHDIPSFRLEIAGDGPCMPELQSLVAELDLQDRVKFLGEVRDIPSLLSRCSLFVLPSLTEGISLTLLEAMAVGLPVVATAVGGNAEVVAYGETGLLVPPANPRALAEAMGSIFSQPEKGASMGLRGHERVEEHFDICKMVHRYENLYEQFVPQPAGGLICP